MSHCPHAWAPALACRSINSIRRNFGYHVLSFLPSETILCLDPCHDGYHLTCHLWPSGWHHGDLNLLQLLPAAACCSPLPFILPRCVYLTSYSQTRPCPSLLNNTQTLSSRLWTRRTAPLIPPAYMTEYFSHIILGPLNIFSTCCTDTYSCNAMHLLNHLMSVGGGWDVPPATYRGRSSTLIL